MSKGSKFIVILLFIITLGLAGGAIYVSNELKIETDITPDESKAGDAGGSSEGLCNVNSSAGTLTVTNPPVGGTALVIRYRCEGTFDLYATSGCNNSSGTILYNGPASELSGKTYTISTGANECITEQIDVDFSEVTGEWDCFVSKGPDVCEVTPTPEPTEPSGDNDCAQECNYSIPNQNHGCASDLACANDYHCSAGDEYKNECDPSAAPGAPCGPDGHCMRVCWGPRCEGGGGGGGTTPTPIPNVSVSGKTVCTGSDGVEVPVGGVEIGGKYGNDDFFSLGTTSLELLDLGKYGANVQANRDIRVYIKNYTNV
ncbi:MAG: hypothetical protein KDC90_16620, partial [Ignavibacteriae bacterium]|nr:hypothetical protein [Ignavibacteriota bacterium]